MLINCNFLTVSSNIEEQWLKKGEQEELKRFGLDLFAGSPSTFAPISDVPVPANYTVGAGDPRGHAGGPDGGRNGIDRRNSVT